MDILLTNGIYLAFYDIYGNLFKIGYLDFDLMDMFFSESFQIGCYSSLFCLYCFKYWGLVDLAHGERIYPFTMTK